MGEWESLSIHDKWVKKDIMISLYRKYGNIIHEIIYMDIVFDS